MGTIYLRMPKMSRHDELKAEHKSPIIEECSLPNKLLDGTDCKIPLDTEGSNSFMSITFY